MLISWLEILLYCAEYFPELLYGSIGAAMVNILSCGTPGVSDLRVRCFCTRGPSWTFNHSS